MSTAELLSFGEHTREVATEILGYSEAEFETLVAEGAV